MIQAIPTLRLIAEKCNVSRSTVSLALKRDPRISSRVVELVTTIADQMGYAPNPKVAEIMGQIARKAKTHRNTLAILLGKSFSDSNPWQQYPWLTQFYRAIGARAEEHGFTIDAFWLGETAMTGRRMKQILLARRIEGIIAFNHLDAYGDIDFDFSDFACAVIGRGPTKSCLDSVGANLHDDLLVALRKTIEHGYRAPGLAIDNAYSPQTLAAWKATYLYHESLLAEREQIPACVYDRNNLGTLKQWYERHSPDAILGLSASTYHDLGKLGIRVPQDAGFVTLLQDERVPDIAGMNLSYQLIGSRAVDLVAEKLRRFEKGLPATPEMILYEGRWTDGRSLPAKATVTGVTAA